MRILPAALLVLAFILPAAAQQPDVEGARRTIAAVEGLLRQRPSDAALWFYLARFQSVAGDKAASIAALRKVEELGDGYLPDRQGFATVWGDTDFQAVRSRIEARLPRLDFAPTAFELSDRALVPEGIAYDAPSKSFFLGSIAQRRIMRVEDGGAAREFAGADAKLDAVLGIAADAPRRILYAVSTSALTDAGRKARRNAVVAFDIDSRRLLGRYDVPGAQQLNDVAIAAGGRVFATDSAAGAVYEIAVKGPGPSRELVPPGRLGGSNGIAASPDGKRLFVAHATGLALVEVATGEVTRIANPTRENVAAIDGLYEWQGQLVGVQNFTNPGRVIVVTLSRDHREITRVQTLLSHHHSALDEPTTGAITERGFYLLAATGVTRYNAKGEIERPGEMPAPTVLRVPLPR